MRNRVPGGRRERQAEMLSAALIRDLGLLRTDRFCCPHWPESLLVAVE
jgi:hypothetical protein